MVVRAAAEEKVDVHHEMATDLLVMVIQMAVALVQNDRLPKSKLGS